MSSAKAMLLALLVGGAALGQSSPVVAARRLMSDGQFEQAVKALDAALVKERDSAEIVRLQLLRGQCLLAVGDAERARAAFVGALKKDPAAALDASRASPDAIDLLERARAELPGVVSVAVNGSASVRIDGKAFGPAPLTVELKPGQHVVEATGEDGRAARLDVLVRPGKTTQLALELTAASSPAARAEVSDAAARPPAPPERCPEGQAVGADTAGHCCWAGQVWADGRCLGVPTKCPRDHVVDTLGQRCAAPACADGMTRASDQLHCCWPGQAWSTSRSSCVGVPRCPAGWSAPVALRDGAERCLKDPALVRAPTGDVACTARGFPGRPRAFTCDVPDYRLKARADLTTEELAELRGQYRAEEVASCGRVATATDCVPRGDQGSGARLDYCCR